MSTVLLIDDDVTGLRARAALLKAVGYGVLMADNASEGIELVREQAIDAVVLDYRLPDLPGEEVLRQLRKMNPALPVIVLSGMLELPTEVKREASAVVVKGEGAQRLLDALKEHVGGQP